MESFQTITIAVLVVSNLVLLAMVLLLAREVGLLLTSLAPARAAAAPDLVPVGLAVEDFELETADGTRVMVRASERVLLAFVSSSCPSCKELMPGLATLAAKPPQPTEVFAIACGTSEGGDGVYEEDFRKAGIPLVVDPETCERFGIEGWPYAILLENGAVRNKGTVNNLQQLEGLYGRVSYVSVGPGGPQGPSARAAKQVAKSEGS